MRPLLAVDGDSFAHRAFHALPRSFRRDDGGPANALVGFMSMLLRLWQAERPRAVVVGWDTLWVADLPQRAARDLPVGPRVRPGDPRPARAAARARLLDRDRLWQGGRVRGRRLPRRRRGCRASPRRRRRSSRPPIATRSSSPATDVTILQPVRGVSELQRIGPAEVRERYGVEPAPGDATSSRCAAIRRTRFPAPAASARRRPRRSSRRTRSGSDDRCRALRRRGRRSSASSAASRRSTRRRRCPTLPDLEPDWAAGAASGRGARRGAPRSAAAGGLTIEPVSHPAHGAPPSDRAITITRDARSGCVRLLERLRPELEGGRASRDAIERAHDPDYVARIAAISEECWLDGDTIGQPTTWEAARLAAGCAIRAVELGGFALVRPPGTTRSPTARWASASSATPSIAARHAQAELGVERVAIVDWDVHHGNGTEAIVRGDDIDPVRLAPPVAVLPRHAAARARATPRSSTFRWRQVRATRDYADAFRELVEPAVAHSIPELLIVSAGFDAHADDPLAGCASPRTGSARWPRAAPSSRRKSRPCSKAATTSTRCRALVEAALEGFSS